jgi:hypothetical protein
MFRRSILLALFTAKAAVAAELRGAGTDNRDLTACTNCWPGTSGPCQQANSVCWNLLYGQCPTGTTLCGGQDPVPPCINTAAYGGLDEGCTTEEPMCVASDGSLLGADVDGDHCTRCVNTQQADWVEDEGCSPQQPTCVNDDGSAHGSTTALNYAGSKCVRFCFNDHTDDGVDSGCDESQSICVSDDTTEPPSGDAGTQCAFCVNTEDEGVDSGCYESQPICVSDDTTEPPSGDAGTQCAFCVNTEDEGSSSLPDLGCSTGEELCALVDTSSPEPNAAGIQCMSLPGPPMPATCDYMRTTARKWGLVANGLDLREYTDGTLEWIGTEGGCFSSFFCTDDATSLRFGANNCGALRVLLDPNNSKGDDADPGSSGYRCSSSSFPNGVTNAPDKAADVQALCVALGYSVGTLEARGVNYCPEAEAVGGNPKDWSSDFASSSGTGLRFRCDNP